MHATGTGITGGRDDGGTIHCWLGGEVDEKDHL
jgi:hypothetical protein